MEKLKHELGREMLQKIWTVFLTYRDNFFANPFSNRNLRLRCYFEKLEGISDKFTVYFHLTRQEKDGFACLSPTPKKIYLYGAFSQRNVWQIRSFGNLREMNSAEVEKFVRIITRRLNGENVGDCLHPEPSENDRNEALAKIQNGSYYCFEPLDYAYHAYEKA